MNRRTIVVGNEPSPRLKALTILQPFATAIVSTDRRAKRVENRSWPRKWPAGGEWVAIHAGARWYPTQPNGVTGLLNLLDDIHSRTGWNTLRPPGLPDGWVSLQSDYPRGALLGVAWFVGCVSVEERLDDPWAVGPWCHVIAEARPLPAPILGVQGSLGFWTVPDEYLPPLLDLIGGG